MLTRGWLVAQRSLTSGTRGQKRETGEWWTFPGRGQRKRQYHSLGGIASTGGWSIMTTFTDKNFD